MYLLLCMLTHIVIDSVVSSLSKSLDIITHYFGKERQPAIYIIPGLINVNYVLILTVLSHLDSDLYIHNRWAS